MSNFPFLSKTIAFGCMGVTEKVSGIGSPNVKKRWGHYTSIMVPCAWLTEVATYAEVTCPPKTVSKSDMILGQKKGRQVSTKLPSLQSGGSS